MSNVLHTDTYFCIINIEVIMMLSSTTLRLDSDVKKDASEIAAEMGLSLSAVMNVLLRQFTQDKGFAVAPRVASRAKTTEGPKTFFDMTPAEIEAACKKAVAEREGNPTMDYVTLLDEESGRIIKKYKDGRVEYVLT